LTKQRFGKKLVIRKDSSTACRKPPLKNAFTPRAASENAKTRQSTDRGE
jgi:hypothetical protein